MNTALNVALIIAALLLSLPVLVLFVEVVAALPGRGQRNNDTAVLPRPRVAAIIPAHNEALGIAHTLQSINAQLQPEDRVVVVADNCSDDTAAMAAAAGAEVIERSDPLHRGKGYALDFAVRHLRQDAPEVVLIIDADCLVEPGAIAQLATRSMATGRPMQALYLMRSPVGAGVKTRLAEFAWLVKNQVRATGLYRLGLPCQLMGTGMAFPWACIRAASLASGHIVEDLKLGLDLALAGTAPLFCPEALVTSYFPASEVGIQGQRTRWEHGHLSVITTEALPLLRKALHPFRRDLFVLALDLCVPPLALLCMLVTLSWCCSAVFYFTSGIGAAATINTCSLLLLITIILAAWLRIGRRVLPFSQLLLAVFYALRKIPLYAKFLVARQVDWVRSRRD